MARPRNARGGKPAHRTRGLARSLAIVAVALVLLWLSVAVSVASFVRPARPNVALMLWPGDGLAKAELAQTALLVGADVGAARKMAEEAFRAEPTAAAAVRVLAILSSDEVQRGERFSYGRELSLRDLPTTLYFIEAAVQRGDATAAMRQYDLALRASAQSAPQVLFPVLNRALADPYLNPRMGAMLVQSEEWPIQFIAYSIQNRTNVVHLARALARHPAALANLSSEAKSRLLSVLADQQAFDEAAQIYGIVAGRSLAPDIVRNGNFAHKPQWPPFDWVVMSSSEVGGAVVPAGSRLQIFSQGTIGGTVARQLVRLSPGRHQLAVRAALTPASTAGSLNLSVSCAAGASQPIGSVAITRASTRDSSSLRRIIEVSKGCSWQWITLEVSAPSSQIGPFEASVDEIAITSAAND